MARGGWADAPTREFSCDEPVLACSDTAIRLCVAVQPRRSGPLVADPNPMHPPADGRPHAPEAETSIVSDRGECKAVTEPKVVAEAIVSIPEREAITAVPIAERGAIIAISKCRAIIAVAGRVAAELRMRRAGAGLSAHAAHLGRTRGGAGCSMAATGAAASTNRRAAAHTSSCSAHTALLSRGACGNKDRSTQQRRQSCDDRGLALHSVSPSSVLASLPYLAFKDAHGDSNASCCRAFREQLA